MTIFPYKWLTDAAKLEQKDFPSLHQFCPSLSTNTPESSIDYSRTSRVLEKPISAEVYSIAKEFYDKNCSNMGDYLRHYNLQDVLPLFKCIEKHLLN